MPHQTPALQVPKDSGEPHPLIKTVGPSPALGCVSSKGSCLDGGGDTALGQLMAFTILKLQDMRDGVWSRGSLYP